MVKKILHYYWSTSYPIQVLAITREDIIQWEYHLDNPNTSVNPKVSWPTLLPNHCTLGRCCITCMIQVNLTTSLSVIPQQDMDVHMSVT